VDQDYPLPGIYDAAGLAKLAHVLEVEPAELLKSPKLSQTKRG
jgi:hypothetical protein